VGCWGWVFAGGRGCLYAHLVGICLVGAVKLCSFTCCHTNAAGVSGSRVSKPEQGEGQSCRREGLAACRCVRQLVYVFLWRDARAPAACRQHHVSCCVQLCTLFLGVKLHGHCSSSRHCIAPRIANAFVCNTPCRRLHSALTPGPCPSTSCSYPKSPCTPLSAPWPPGSPAGRQE
jgi:hypothetical protein